MDTPPRIIPNTKICGLTRVNKSFMGYYSPLAYFPSMYRLAIAHRTARRPIEATQRGAG
jgi:hypothetical protein